MLCCRQLPPESFSLKLSARKRKMKSCGRCRGKKRSRAERERERGCFWMVGQVDRWHWVALADCRVWLQHVCHTHTHTRTLRRGAATWTVCLSADFAVVFVFIHFLRLCELKLLYYFALISNFLRIIFVLFIYSRRDLYNTSAHVYLPS